MYNAELLQWPIQGDQSVHVLSGLLFSMLQCYTLNIHSGEDGQHLTVGQLRAASLSSALRIGKITLQL